MNPFNEKEEYEISTFAENHFTIKFINRAENVVTLYTATRVIIPPPLTFMQKYGMSIVMAVMIIVQVYSYIPMISIDGCEDVFRYWSYSYPEAKG